MDILPVNHGTVLSLFPAWPKIQGEEGASGKEEEDKLKGKILFLKHNLDFHFKDGISL